VFFPAFVPSGLVTDQFPIQKSNSVCLSVQQLQVLVCAEKGFLFVYLTYELLCCHSIKKASKKRLVI